VIAGGLLLSASIFLWGYGPAWLATLVTVLGLYGILVSSLRVRELRSVPRFTPDEARTLLESGRTLDEPTRSVLQALAG